MFHLRMSRFTVKHERNKQQEALTRTMAKDSDATERSFGGGED